MLCCIKPLFFVLCLAHKTVSLICLIYSCAFLSSDICIATAISLLMILICGMATYGAYKVNTLTSGVHITVPKTGC